MEKESNQTQEILTQKETQDSAKELDLIKEKFNALENASGEKDRQIAGLKQALTEAGNRQADLDSRLSGAIASYRTLAAGANVNIPAELLSGDSIQAIDESLAKARSLVGKIRQGIEKEASAIRVPGGAPVRTAPDTAGMSPREKIKYAMGNNSRK